MQEFCFGSVQCCTSIFLLFWLVEPMYMYMYNTQSLQGSHACTELVSHAYALHKLHYLSKQLFPYYSKVVTNKALTHHTPFIHPWSPTLQVLELLIKHSIQGQRQLGTLKSDLVQSGRASHDLPSSSPHTKGSAWLAILISLQLKSLRRTVAQRTMTMMQFTK